MFGKILGVIIAILAVVFVIFVTIKSYIDRKKGKTCCSDCSRCSCSCSIKNKNTEIEQNFDII